jgi:2-keto-4-pentenoate hydratase/2-oxohepta-3-ene-1,7-dioic acid hydratase in catechol pathway
VRIGNLDGRLVIVRDEGVLDVEELSDGLFPADPQAIYQRWDEFRDWAASHPQGRPSPLDPERLRAPVPRPPQVFGIGLNYRDHAAEAGLAIPEEPVVFTKFPSSVTGPSAEVTLPSDKVDYEIELVAVIGRRAHRVPVEDGWSFIAGLTVGQDLSEREMQWRGTAPQFSLAKSFDGFAPIGPVVVTPDEFDNPDRLDLGCRIGGEKLQQGNTGDLIFGIPELVARLSQVVTLLPGDLVFTGTPAGVGATRTPPRFLRRGEVLTSYVTGIGEIRTSLV